MANLLREKSRVRNKKIIMLAVTLLIAAACAGCDPGDAVPASEVKQEMEEEKQKSELIEATLMKKLSISWTDMELIFGGINYTLPCSYQELAESGWTIDLADYGYEDGYTMEPGEMTYGTMDLENPQYSDKIRVQVGFYNDSDMEKDILECNIWSLTVDISRVVEEGETHPEFALSNGIMMGSSRDDVEAVCGPCEDVREVSEYNYVTYSYQVNYTYYLKMDIHEKYGVTFISLKTYE